MNDEVYKWYFTFGNGTNLADRYAVIENDSEYVARAEFIALQGNNNWAFTYCEEDFLPQIEQFGLTEVELPCEVYYK